MKESARLQKIKDAVRKRVIPTRFTGRDLVRIGIPEGTAWTFLYKHCIDRGKGYETFQKYFRQHADETYSLLKDC